MSVRVLFVSKPVAPPYHDGTKCLVRDVASHLEVARPTVMSVPGGEAVGAAEVVPVYSSSGHFTPSARENLRAAAWLLLRSRADVWHFVFAPNPKTTLAGRTLKQLRRVPVVQTVASAPRSFAGVDRLLFGDVVVAQSRFTRSRIEQAVAAESARPRRLAVIPPPVPDLAPRSAASLSAMRQRLGIAPSAPVFVYPGDLETSSGARVVAESVAPLTEAIPEAVVVFAYRAKTPRAAGIAAALERDLPRDKVRFTAELPDVLELIAGAAAVLFPVDDLWGKVDLPIVLLEAMALGVPVVALRKGPLIDLAGVVHVDALSAAAFAAAAARSLRDREHRQAVIEAQRAAVRDVYAAPAVARAYERLYLDLARG